MFMLLCTEHIYCTVLNITFCGSVCKITMILLKKVTFGVTVRLALTVFETKIQLRMLLIQSFLGASRNKITF